MISPCDLHVPRMLRNLGRPLALLLLFDIVVVVAYVYFEQRWLALPNLPLAIGGGALGVILGFRNNNQLRTVVGGSNPVGPDRELLAVCGAAGGRLQLRRRPAPGPRADPGHPAADRLSPARVRECATLSAQGPGPVARAGPVPLERGNRLLARREERGRGDSAADGVAHPGRLPSRMARRDSTGPARQRPDGAGERAGWLRADQEHSHAQALRLFHQVLYPGLLRSPAVRHGREPRPADPHRVVPA